MPKCEYCEIRGWGGKAFCHKKDDYVTDDFYYDFCNTYKYDDCPYYRGSSSGCYLTTACVDAMEFPDDCLELQTMRRLRDEYILPNIENGRKIVEEYYAKAPQIVSAINAKENSIEIWKDIYLNEITPCVKTALQEGFHSA